MPVPSNISDLSTTAASNSPAGSDPIGGNLDDYLRAIQAILRSESLVKSWEAPGHAATWLSATQFTVPGDLTSTYRVGRRLRVTLSGLTRVFCTVDVSAFGAGVTTVTVVNDSSPLTAPISGVELGPDVIALVESGSRVASRAWAAAYVAGLTASTSAAGIVQLAGTTAVNDASPSSSLVLTVEDLRAGNVVRGAAVATTSGTSRDFTGIPSWAKRVTVVLADSSTNGSDYYLLQLGDSGGIEPTGYVSTISFSGTAAQATNGFLVSANSAGTTSNFTGAIHLYHVGGNTWICSGVTGSSGIRVQAIFNGSKTLSAALDRVRLTTFSGADTFDAGSYSVFWE